MSDAMRIEVALGKAELLRQRAKEKQKKAGGDKTRAGALLSEVSKPEESINVRKTVADEAGVSEGTVHNYMQLSKHPELLEKVKNGELKIDTAHRLQESEIIKQLKRVDRMITFLEKHYPIKGNDAANKEIKEGIIRLLGHIEEIKRSHNEQVTAHKPRV